MQFEPSNEKAASFACEKLNGYFLEDNGELVVKKRQPVQANNAGIDLIGKGAGGEFPPVVASQFRGGVGTIRYPKAEVVASIHDGFNPETIIKKEGLQPQFYTSFQNQPIIAADGDQGAGFDRSYIKRRRLSY